MKHYTVEYLNYQSHNPADIKKEYIVAKNKQDAYFKFLRIYGYVYAAWVARVTCNNGNVIEFNTFPGKPY